MTDGHKVPGPCSIRLEESWLKMRNSHILQTYIFFIEWRIYRLAKRSCDFIQYAFLKAGKEPKPAHTADIRTMP